jgi:outer membrane receptor protein involved in Fe transport
MSVSKSFFSRRSVRASASLLALTAGLGLCAIEAHAQNAATTSLPTAAAPDDMLTEVVVTARKRSERLQDVPISVDVASAEQLQKNNVRDFKDILRNMPGVSFSGSEMGQSRYNIRGISTNSASPTVGVYLDDVSLLTISTNFAGAVDPVFLDMGRVEVLKGPQGTLYGGNAMGGAIKYVSEQPRLNETSGAVGAGVSFTEHGDASYNLQGVVNLPVVEDKLAVRAGVLYRADGGYVDNIANGAYLNYTQSTTNPPAAFAPTSSSSLSTRASKNQNGSDVLGLRLSALFEPTPTLRITPALFYQDYHQDNPGVLWTNLPGLASSFRIAQPTDDKFGLASLTVVKEMGGLDLTSLTGYVDRALEQRRDYSFYVGNLVPPFYSLNSPNQSNSFTHTFSQEVRIATNDPSARLQYTVGAYYSDQSDRLKQTVITQGGGAVLGTGSDVTYYGWTAFQTQQSALFGNLTYTVAPKLDVTVGVRAFRIKQDQANQAGGLFNGGDTTSSGHSKQTGINPKFEVAYRATSDNLLYASATKGFRPGGINTTFASSLCSADLQNLGLTSIPNGFESDKLWTYQLGSKNQFLNRRLTLNAAAYYTDWSNIQQTILLNGCGFAYTGNVGAAEVKGIELGGQYQLARGLVAGGGLNYANAKITETSQGVSAQVGQQVLDSPKWVGNAFVAYGFEIGRSTLELRADYQYHGSQLRDFGSTFVALSANGAPEVVANPNQRLDSYSLVNLNATLSYDRWEFSLYGNNVFDKDPVIDFNPTNAFSQALTVRPRTVGASLKTRF